MSPEPWSVDSVEVMEPGTATPLRGRAWLLGTGVTAHCSTASGLSVVLRVAVVDERLVVEHVAVAAAGQPVTGTVLRSVPVDRLVRLAFDSLDAEDWAAQRAVDASARLDEVVSVWRSLQGGSDAHRATAATAQRMSLSRGYVSRLLTRARDEGLIPR